MSRTIRMIAVGLMMVFILASACGPTPVTPERDTQTPTPAPAVLRSVSGAVTAFNLQTRQLVIFDVTARKEYTLGVNDSTQVIVNGQPAGLNTITVNMPVDVTFDEVTMLATRIILGEAPPLVPKKSILGALISVDLERRQVVVSDANDGDKRYTLSVNDSTQIILEGHPASLSEIVGRTHITTVTFDPVTSVAINITVGGEAPRRPQTPTTPGP